MATAKRYRKDGGMRAASCCSERSSSHGQNKDLYVHPAGLELAKK